MWSMQKRTLGGSAIEITPLVLGGNVFGWTADEATSFAILDAFVDAGGTMIDTADVYSFWVPGHEGGESERVIGAWLKRSGKRDKVQIGTKVGFIAGLAPDVIRSACEASLERLGTDYIDVYYQHKDDDKVPLDESLGAFEALRREGKIRAVGLSQFEPPRLAQAVATAERNGFARPCVLQTWYNLLERRKLEGPLLDSALDAGVSVMPFYALANGYLTGKYRSREDLDKSVRGLRNIEYLEGKGPRILAALDEVAAETGAALGAIAIAWTIARPGIAGALASATSVEQLRDSIAALTLELSPDQRARLDAASVDAEPA
jgi:aryl-alcohol dehydrogenase-like predicted oxidoreductase